MKLTAFIFSIFFIIPTWLNASCRASVFVLVGLASFSTVAIASGPTDLCLAQAKNATSDTIMRTQNHVGHLLTVDEKDQLESTDPLRFVYRTMVMDGENKCGQISVRVQVTNGECGEPQVEEPQFSQGSCPVK